LNGGEETIGAGLSDVKDSKSPTVKGVVSQNKNEIS
jgi:hypothetical protein